MSLQSIQQFSTTASSNTDVDGISCATGWPPSNVGPAFRELMALLASALQPLSVSITGLPSLTLTAPQASAQSIQLTGALTAPCTVTFPDALFIGLVQNLTTGGQDVVLTAGIGATATIPADGNWYFYWADGATNASLLSLAVKDGTAGKEAVNFSQFDPHASANGSCLLPGGLILNWGIATTPSGGGLAVGFDRSYSVSCFSVTCTTLTVSPPATVSAVVASLSSFNASSFQSDVLTGFVAFYWMAIGK